MDCIKQKLLKNKREDKVIKMFQLKLELDKEEAKKCQINSSNILSAKTD